MTPDWADEKARALAGGHYYCRGIPRWSLVEAISARGPMVEEGR